MDQSSDQMAESDDSPTPRSPLWHYLGGRLDGLSSAILVFPLFLIYQIGILTGRGQNGVDFLTRALIDLGKRDVTNYLITMSVLLVVYAAVLVLLRKRGSFSPQAFGPMLLESSIYALVMGSIILFVMQKFLGVLPGLFIGVRNPIDVVVISAGAGFHEELIFRVILMGGMAWLLTGLTGKKRAWLIALAASSVLFSIAHHIGPAGEAFTFSAFVYRSLAGVFFALVYQMRGFAVAAWTHALYDLYVLSLG